MPARFQLRDLTDKEKDTLSRLSRSRTAPKREVERAQIVMLWLEGEGAVDIARHLNRNITTIYHQLKQFNKRGLLFLQDELRSGRPLIYNEYQRSQIILTARTKPGDLDCDFGHWTLDLLVEYVNQTLGIPISRSQLAEVLDQEGLKWYQEKTYFSESPDPQFVEKRGQS